MDIIKKNIHMGRIRTQASNQVSYEDDLNIPENKPDVSTILLHKGEVEIPKGNRHVVLWNVGMVLFIAFWIVMIILWYNRIF